MVYMFAAIFVVSLILAISSMKDLNAPEEISKLISMRKIRGSIVFFKNKVHHYTSSSSSSSSTST
jgi:hypothetical protein